MRCEPALILCTFASRQHGGGASRWTSHCGAACDEDEDAFASLCDASALAEHADGAGTSPPASSCTHVTPPHPHPTHSWPQPDGPNKTCMLLLLLLRTQVTQATPKQAGRWKSIDAGVDMSDDQVWSPCEQGLGTCACKDNRALGPRKSDVCHCAFTPASRNSTLSFVTLFPALPAFLSVLAPPHSSEHAASPSLEPFAPGPARSKTSRAPAA